MKVFSSVMLYGGREDGRGEWGLGVDMIITAIHQKAWLGRGWRWRERGDRGGRGGKQERGVEIKIEFEGKSEFEVGLEFLTYDGFKLFKYLEYFIGSLMKNNNQNGWMKKKL